MKKRLLSIVLILAMVMNFGILPAFAAGSATLEISPNTTGLKAGDEVTVTATVPQVSGVASGMLKLTFDKATLEVQRIDAPATFAGYGTTVTSVSTANSVGAFSISIGNGATHNFDMPEALVLSATFLVRDTASAGEKANLVAIDGENYYFEDEDSNSVTAPTFNKTSISATVVSELAGTQTITMAKRPSVGNSLSDPVAAAVEETSAYNSTFFGWAPATGTFAAETTYTATGVLNAKSGYKFASDATVALASPEDGESVTLLDIASNGAYLRFTYQYTTPGLPSFGYTPDAPGLSSKAGGDVTLNHTSYEGQTIEYGWSHSADKATAGHWQESNAFTGLEADDYYFFMRIKAKAGEHCGGPTSDASAKITVFAAPQITGYGSLDSLVIGTEVNAAPTVDVPAGVATTNPYSMTGTLPDGLNFSTTDGKITGTPTDVSETGGSVTITVTDTESVTSAAYTLNYGPVAKKSQTIIASNVAATYGDTDKSVSATATGTVSYAVKEGSEDYISVATDGKLTIKKAGEAWVIVTADATEECAEATEEVKVTISPKAVTAAMIAEIADQTYTGSAITPTPTITDGSALTENTDFSYSYSDNTYAGTSAKVTITGQGNYTGTAEKAFTIKAADQTPVITATKSLAKGGNTLDLRTLVAGNQGDVTFEITSGTAATLGAEKYILTSDASNTGDVVLTVNITAKDVNGDGTDDYSAYTGTNAITVNVTTKTTAALAGGVSQTGCIYGETLADPTYTAPEGTISTTITYSGTLRKDGTSYSDTNKPDEAGDYTVTVKCETATHIYQASDTFTIAPKPITGADVTLGTALTYNAASQTQTVATVKLGGTDITTSCDVSNNVQTNAGSYQLTVTAKALSNYIGSVNKDFTIAKKSITPTIEVTGTYTYTGSAITPTYTVKDGSTVLAATDYNAVVSDNINAGNGKITVTAADTGNYTFSEKQETFVIGKATYGDQTATGAAKYGTTGTVELSSYLKTGYALGTITMTNEAFFDGTPTMDGTKLKFTFANVAANAGQTAEITVPVTSATNYNTYSIKVTVTVNAKTVPTVTAPTAVSGLTYDGTAKALISAGATNGGEMQYSLTSGSGYSTAIPTATNANTYTVYYKVVGDSEYADVAEASVSVTIAKKDVTVAPKDFTITKGNAIPTFELEYTGLVGSDTLTPSATPDFTCYETGTTPVSTTTAAGTYTITWANEGVTTFTGADNYNVTKTATGTLTINNLAPSGGGGGGGVSTYAISVDSAKNGTVTVSPKNAAKGATVTITVKPDKGFELDTLKVVDKNGDKVKLTEKNGKYTFTMPASKVYVEATFMEDNSMLNFFVDVPADAYYYDAVLWAAKNGITGGVDDTHFAPNATCTRAQAVTFLWRAAGSPAPKSSMMPFTDVPAGSYYETAVLWAVENGITKGTSDTMFSPDATCTRAQIVTFLWRANGSPAVSGNSAFTDVASDAYYAAAVTWAEKNDVTGGIGGGLFGSNNNCTRAQIVTFIYRSVK